MGMTGGSKLVKFNGRVQNPTTAGFFIHGTYSISGQNIGLKTRMARQGSSKFVGNGRGLLNNDQNAAIKYTLIMTKQ